MMKYVGARRRSRALSALAVSIAVVLAGAGCSALNPGGTAGSASPASGKKLSADDVRKAGDITLTLTDYQTGGFLDALHQNIAAFEKEYPNITIQASEKDFTDYGKTIGLTASSNTAPDIVEINAAMAPRLVGGGLVRPLDAYVGAYKWADSYPKGIDAGLKLSADGKVFGEGKYWGMALGGNLVGVFYNKKILQQLNLDAPQTMDQFVAAMAAAKAAGVLPLEMGNLDQIQAGHVASTLLAYKVSPDDLNAWINGKKGSTIDTPGAADALKTLKSWVDAGYISSQANGIKEDDGASDFAAGKALFDITGSWRTTQFDTGLGQDGGFMLLPGSTVNAAPATGWFAEGWGISSKSKHADIAAFFLDYLAGENGQKTNVAGGYLPFAPGGQSTGGPVAQDVMAQWYKAVQANGLSGYIDSASPTMGTTEFPALQSLIAGQTSVGDVITAMQNDWTQYHKGS